MESWNHGIFHMEHWKVPHGIMESSNGTLEGSIAPLNQSHITPQPSTTQPLINHPHGEIDLLPCQWSCRICETGF
jgi:hypothetical protein